MTFFEQHKAPVTHFRNHGEDDQEERTVEGMKNREEGGGRHMIQFAEQEEIEVGDVLKVGEARDRWEVVEVEDITSGGKFVNFNAYVKKV